MRGQCGVLGLSQLFGDQQCFAETGVDGQGTAVATAFAAENATAAAGIVFNTVLDLPVAQQVPAVKVGFEFS